MRSEWFHRASCRVRTAKAARARRCCGGHVPASLLRGCTVRRARRLPPCIAARRRLSVMVRRSEPKRPSCTESVCVSVLFASSSALLCFGRSFSGALRRGHFFAFFAANICCAAALRPRLRQKARFPQRGNASSKACSPCSSTRMRFWISVISNVICAASRTVSMALIGGAFLPKRRGRRQAQRCGGSRPA